MQPWDLIRTGIGRGDLGGFQAFGMGELRQCGDRLIAGVAHHHLGDDVRVLDNFRFHRWLLSHGLSGWLLGTRRSYFSPSFLASSSRPILDRPGRSRCLAIS